MKLLKLLAAVLVLAVNTASPGLLTPFTESILNSVEPGVDYVLTGPREVKLMVKNTSGSQVKVKVGVVKPAKNELKEDYKQIPDIDWITVKDKFLNIEPGQWGQTEAILRVPKEKKYYGKSYQAYIHTQTTKGKIRAGLKSRVLFTVKERRGFFKKIFWFLK